jgi:hypothetical protein
MEVVLMIVDRMGASTIEVRGTDSRVPEPGFEQAFRQMSRSSQKHHHYSDREVVEQGERHGEG